VALASKTPVLGLNHGVLEHIPEVRLYAGTVGTHCRHLLTSLIPKADAHFTVPPKLEG